MNYANLRKYLHALGWPLTAAAASLLLSACDSTIYDDEGDCSVTYQLSFRYDRNLKWADAFANEVASVHLYAFTPEGTLVREYNLPAAPIVAAGNTLTLDLPTGDYRLVAWCGIDAADTDVRSFAVPELTVGSSTPDDLSCRLNRTPSADYGAVCSDRLNFLFHGAKDVHLPDLPDGGVHRDTISLTKDTNHIRIILQQLSGEGIDVRDFGFRIEDANGLMAYDNTLLPDEQITYLPWDTATGQAGLGKDDLGQEADGTRAVIYVDGAIADLTVGRMMADRAHDMMLTITNRSNGETVARVPVIDYALLSKEYYEMAYRHAMSDQEFLDREDEYVLTFFLDEDRRWISSSILIHSWRIVLQDVDLH